MSNNKWGDVFEAHPKANEIYVCDGMPYLDEKLADKHAHSTGKPVVKVARMAVVKEPTKSQKKAATKKSGSKKLTTAQKKAAADKLAADKAAADAKAAAENGEGGEPSSDNTGGEE